MRIGNYAFDSELALKIAEQVGYAVAILLATLALSLAALLAFAIMV